METNFKINSKSEQTIATYTKDGYRVEITYNVDKVGGDIRDINMSVYGDAKGDYIGNVNANANGAGELTYNLSGIPQGKLAAVCALVGEINSAIAANMAGEDASSADNASDTATDGGEE